MFKFMQRRNGQSDANNMKKKSGFVSEFLLPVGLGILLVFLLRYFVFGLYYVPSGSMIPTLQVNDHIIATYNVNDIKRGDITVFYYPVDYNNQANDTKFVKRLIGLPGETIEIKDNKLYINNQEFEEPYLTVDVKMENFGPITLTENEYFMMGDNRNHSNDSRYWGTVSKDLLIGKGQAIYWPLNRIQILNKKGSN